MSVFRAKLDTLTSTIESAIASDTTALALALRGGAGQQAIAVGSGGSAIASSYFASCRKSLGLRDTTVQTPLEFATDDFGLQNAQVWLFSAGGANPDILAAFDAAIVRGATSIHIATREKSSPLLERARKHQHCVTHFVPTAEPKDGFLATHSLVAIVAQLLMAADACSRVPIGAPLAHDFKDRCEKLLGPASRLALAEKFSGLSQNSTIFILQDPRLTPLALLLETSAWEAALCAVQRTDFRNFAHGRHVWLGRRPDTSFILALTGTETQSIWQDMQSVLPSTLRRLHLDFANCGRFENACAIVAGLTTIEAIGAAVDIDPGRPGIAPFARDLYEARSLERLSSQLSAPVRHKRIAAASRDDPQHRHRNLAAAWESVLTRIGETRFAGLVLDYDGTLVTFEGRYGAPEAKVVASIQRLLDEGMRISVATGRGGSAGEKLREAFPNHHDAIIMHYYNGAHTCLLGVDITANPPAPDPRLDNARAVLAATTDAAAVKDSGVQLTVFTETLSDPEAFAASLKAQLGDAGALRVTMSAHTIDVATHGECKTAAARTLGEELGETGAVLCIGDCGAWTGNDFEMLGLPFGVSVGEVCDRPDVCWSFFGALASGPDALVQVLAALVPTIDGGHRFDPNILGAWRGTETGGTN